MSTSPGGDPYGGQQRPPLNPYQFPSAPTPDPHPDPHPEPQPDPYPGRRPPGEASPEPQYRQPRIQPFAPPQAPPPRASQGPQGGGSADAPPRGRRPAPSGLVRPYAMTGGRTRPRYQLAIEALVSTTADPERLRGQLPEHQRICLLCREVKSIAEISALLTIPLGVVRILVADLAEAGLVAIHQPGGDAAAGGQPDVTLLERVLSGLRKL
ncbi:DUF742 domain-containing protein [Streptomyces sp. NBC_01190]|uniref:DUF742 domain-containing protein n=1 Tax=Streptomyces sp. NBC_01190 TaxID=2903767 RepID=UPI0038671A53|nr:DUF742 domain-containing protein [Streptomyces sp. NBC_01190]